MSMNTQAARFTHHCAKEVVFKLYSEEFLKSLEMYQRFLKKEINNVRKVLYPFCYFLQHSGRKCCRPQ